MSTRGLVVSAVLLGVGGNAHAAVVVGPLVSGECAEVAGEAWASCPGSGSVR